MLSYPVISMSYPVPPRFEKMTSGMYFREIVRQILIDQPGEVFCSRGHITEPLKRDQVVQLLSDRLALLQVRSILLQLRLNSIRDDSVIVKVVWSILLQLRLDSIRDDSVIVKRGRLGTSEKGKGVWYIVSAWWPPLSTQSDRTVGRTKWTSLWG
ncbi:hexokinase-1-like [Oncorhynchus tshawytscha]|uniref:hexokinase-1-like n=1 Tax=Oncorhynchus tshawytscha TaxID=74940 RepID=UPI001C3E61F0|nr:hexokinase-1-like [Oncorhynchus tshawytscha]